MSKNVGDLIQAVSESRGITRDEVREAFESAVKAVFPTADIDVEIGGNGVAPGVFRYLTVGKGVTLEDARQHVPEAAPGDLVRMPVSLDEGGRRLLRWLLNKHLSAAETDRLYRKWLKEKGRAVLGSVIGPDGKKGMYVDLGDVIGVLERHRMTPGEEYRPGVEFMFLVAKVSLEVKTGGRLMIVLSRNSRRLSDAILRQMAPGIKFVTVKRIAGKRCVVIKGLGKLPRRVVADVSRLLGEVIQIREDETEQEESKEQKDPATA